ncbi:MAG TPA: NAD(P)/FAD-dependent oxidoreductase [Baekduia sp.]|nr:NAD(P)/FAD-dependent oxidoreductase [Baekduia sp.]
MTEVVDAVVVGAGPNGLAAANVLADAGWDVVVLEGQATPGGAVRTEQLTEPGFHHDVFSSFYPLGAAAPTMRELHLEDHGLRWCHAPAPVAHVLDGERAAVLHRDPERTAESLARFAPSDREAWLRWSAWWARTGPHLVDALMRPFPPVRAGGRLARTLGAGGLLELGRLGVLTVRRHTSEEFSGEGARVLLAGNALHADFTPESPGGAIYGWTLVGLGQQVGFPIPEGGAARLAEAMVRRLEAAGGALRCGQRVVRIDGRTRDVHTAGGATVRARRAVLAATDAPTLYEDLLQGVELPDRLRSDLRRFEWDPSTIKVDWALDGPIPWTAPGAELAGTVHLADDLDFLTRWGTDLQLGRVPERPFVVLGQYARADPTRMPAGKEVGWAYTHIPQGSWRPGLEDEIADRVEAEVERRAPGFRALIRARHVLAPPDFEARDANLRGGALNGGTAQLHQQLVFRPVPGLGRASTPVGGVYLASASAHPGGGVHGAAGTNAARAALAAQKAPRRARTAGTVLTRMVRSRKTDQRSR